MKILPQNRLFFQVSADGIGENHDKTRGAGGFKKLLNGLKFLNKLSTRNTISMVVHSENISQMKDMIDLADEYSIDSVHFMWLIITGRAKPEIFVEPETIFLNLVKAHHHAGNKGIEIDNIKNMESQIFSPAGTKYDLGNAGWISLAIGPDRNIYPTAALVGEKKLNCGSIDNGIENIWKNSKTLKEIRGTSVKDSQTYKNSAFKFITGGGDIDHSYYNGGEFEGHDPYLLFIRKSPQIWGYFHASLWAERGQNKVCPWQLYEKMILWIISKTAKESDFSAHPRILLKMGDRLLQCHSQAEGVSLTHSNCVLTFSNTRKVVGDFYKKADFSQNDNESPVHSKR